MSGQKSAVIGNVVGLVALWAVGTACYWGLIDLILSDPDSEGDGLAPFVAFYVFALAVYLVVSVRYLRRPVDRSGTSS